MSAARFDAPLPERLPRLPADLAAQLSGPTPDQPAWRWLLQRGWRETRLRRFLASGDSRALLHQFVDEADLDQSQWRIPARLLPSFEALLARQLLPHTRLLEGGQQSISFPVDGAHRLVPIHHPDQPITLSPWTFRAADLFPVPELWPQFRGGFALVSSPAVTDCHRVSFPLAGVPEAALTIQPGRPAPGPRLLQRWTQAGLPCGHLQHFASRHAGPVLLLELGGCGPGGVVQTHQPGEPVQRGDDKSWLRFGANWVLCWFRPNTLYPAPDLPIDPDGNQVDLTLRALRGQRLGMVI